MCAHIHVWTKHIHILYFRYNDGEIHFNLMAIVSDRKITYEKKISQIEKQMEVGTLTVIIKTVFLLSQTVNIIWDEFVKLLQ
jgi:hypothetical protein